MGLFFNDFIISLISKIDIQIGNTRRVFVNKKAAGFKIVATKGTQKVLADAEIVSEFVYKLNEGRPNIIDLMTNGKIDLMINTPITGDQHEDDSDLRKTAIKKKVPYITTIAAAKATADGIKAMNKPGCGVVKSLQELHAEITDK